MERVPAIDGWFRMGEPGSGEPGSEHAPHLIGTRCTACSTYFFPRETSFCRNPDCSSRSFEEVELSNRGRLWSWTTNHYPPPAPYVAADPFVPYTIAAVELPKEKMVVLGQLADGVDAGSLRTGMDVELAVGTLFTDESHDYVVWKWRPV